MRDLIPDELVALIDDEINASAWKLRVTGKRKPAAERRLAVRLAQALVDRDREVERLLEQARWRRGAVAR